MKVCFFGLGSIGTRHLKNLCTIAGEKGINLKIHAFRNTKKHLEKGIEDIIETIIYNENKLENDYDIVFIANPSSMHFDTIKLMEGKTKNMFIEKPLCEDSHYDFSSILEKPGVYYVACPLRYSNTIQELSKVVNSEKIFCVRVICSSYLPDWRPNTDYREGYSARKDFGGGVRADLIHEWDYITYLFGYPKDVKCIYGKYSDLEIDSEDVAIYIARYEDKVVELHLDYFGRVPKRSIELFTQKGTIVCDMINNTISYSDKSESISFDMDRNSVYIREMEFFIENVMQKTNFNNILHSKKIIDLARRED
jgi:predicted dehydrogenase